MQTPVWKSNGSLLYTFYCFCLFSSFEQNVKLKIVSNRMWFVRVCVNEQPPLIKIYLPRSVMEWDKQEAYSLKDDTVF